MASSAAQLDPTDSAIHRHERRHALSTLGIAAMLVAASFGAYEAGWLRLETAIPSAGRFALETSLFVLVFDFYFYALHRLLHTRRLYSVHAVHHVSKHPRPLTALSFHPVEGGLLLVYAPLAMLFFPIHLASISVGGAVLAGSIAIAHWGTECFPDWWHRSPWVRWIATPSVHEGHHRRFDCNFSAPTSIPDRLFGTYRLEVRPAKPRAADGGETLTRPTPPA